MTTRNLPATTESSQSQSVISTDCDTQELHASNRFAALFYQETMFKVIRTTEGESVLQAKEVAEFLGYADPDQAIHQHCKNIKKIVTKDGTHKRHVLAITEPDLFRLIIRSKKPEAQEFEAWVMEEVLPCIHKTGKYKMGRKLNPSEEGQKILDEAKRKEEELKNQLDFFPVKIKLEFQPPVASKLGEERKRLIESGIELPTEIDLISYIVTKYFEEVV